jgi:large subunit ribosomal protein L30e
MVATKMKKSLELSTFRLQIVMKSGKYGLTLKRIRQGKVKLVIPTNNCPALRTSEVEDYAILAKTCVHHYSGNNTELGAACKKCYRVSTLSLIQEILISLEACQNRLVQSKP